MQLEQKKSTKKKIIGSLTAAACSLLSGMTGPSIAAEAENKWSFDTAVQYYGERDRVTDYSGKIMARRTFVNGRRLTLSLGADALTGASANGAIAYRMAQTFTSPSGESSYTTAAGETPLDPSFQDTRLALAANWEQPLGRQSRGDLGVSFSNEYDYLHTGINARYSRDFNKRNTTLDISAAFARDSIDPEGGAPVPLAAMLGEGDQSTKMGSDSKTVADFLVGVTQVLGRRTLGRINYSLRSVSGYLNDPYKVVSVVDPLSGDPVPGSGDLNLYLYESRPDSRVKHTLFGQLKHHFQRDVTDISYRFMTDDWGISSHTVDLRYRWIMPTWYLQPHLRYYMQSEADFYVTHLLDGDPLPENASADYRLGDLDTYTIGLKYGRPFGDGMEWSVRLEYYQQLGTDPSGSMVGSLADFDQTPDVDALILQFGFRF